MRKHFAGLSATAGLCCCWYCGTLAVPDHPQQLLEFGHWLWFLMKAGVCDRRPPTLLPICDSPRGLADRFGPRVRKPLLRCCEIRTIWCAPYALQSTAVVDEFRKKAMWACMSSAVEDSSHRCQQTKGRVSSTSDTCQQTPVEPDHDQIQIMWLRSNQQLDNRDIILSL